MQQLPVGLESLPNPLLRVEPGLAGAQFRGTQGQIATDRPQLVGEISLGGITLPLAVITVSSEKAVTMTPIAGADNEVIEIVNIKRWSIKIRGFGIERNPQDGVWKDKYPAAKLREMIRLYRRNEALDVECRYLNYFGIDRLVIKDARWPDMAGTKNAFAYELDAVADYTPELIIS